MVVLLICHVSHVCAASFQHEGAETCEAGAGWHSVVLSQAAFNENEHWLDLGKEKCLGFLSWQREESKV